MADCTQSPHMMTAFIDENGEYHPGIVHPDPATLLTSSGGKVASGISTDPNLDSSISPAVQQYNQFDSNGNWIATWYRNPSGIFV